MNKNFLLKMSFDIEGNNFNAAGAASSEIKRKLKQIGLNSDVVRRAAVSAYEAEMNIVIHAYKGVLTVTVSPGEINILAEDEGPGIADIELAMKEGYSTASDDVREMGFGAGMGLPNMKKCSDKFEIKTELGVGTKVSMTIYY
ncbi:MAG: hypothetical protein PWQ82_449 [Thermosediminibacterales bacterium]|nr:hypothetical protein [Thermosediminibacterales bacterium]MDK2835745.1 hypothetical protein [Thermosediminibacterales bacterium]